jgi:1,4-dihydroxy-2-naphthoate polyprenyltransferase
LNAETTGSYAGLKRYLYSFGAMARPLFVVGIVPLYALGATAAWADMRSINVPLLAAGLVAVWLVQLMTHYNNEYCDLETDQATAVPTLISGGSRVLVRKLVSRASARKAALACLLLAVILSLVMVFVLGAGVWAFAFIAAAAFPGWNYSSRPLKLKAAGLGEATLILISCFLLPATSYYLQAGTVRPGFLVTGIPVALLTLALILTTEIPDREADGATGKRTLAVRLGKDNALKLMMASLAAGWAAFVLVIGSLWSLWGGAAAVVSLPLMAVIWVWLKSSPRRGPRGLEKPGLAISLLVGYTSICLALSFVFG